MYVYMCVCYHCIGYLIKYIPYRKELFFFFLFFFFF